MQAETINSNAQRQILARILDLREQLRTVVSDFLDWDSGPIHQCQQQIRERCLIWILQMLVPFDSSIAAADDGGRQRKMVMRIAVAHIAAIKEDRMIQHRTVAIR